MSPSAASVLDERDCFPRVSGDEPNTKTPAPAIILFSPRERG